MYHPRFKGTPYDAGLQFGKLLRKSGGNFAEGFPFTDERQRFARQSLPIYQQIYPEVVEEIQGVADGLGGRFEELITFLFSMYCFTLDVACSCFAISDGKNIIFGRNSDFMVAIEKYYKSTFYKLNNTYAFIGNTTGFIEMEDGINERGLAAGLTFIYPVKTKAGINAGMMVRYILEKCSTVREAVDFVKSIPIASQNTLTLTDSTGDIAVVECNCEQVEVTRPTGERQYVAITNDFKSEAMQKYRYHGEDDIFSGVRYATLQKALCEQTCYSIDFAMELLSGKHGFLCQYDRKQGFDTVWSSVYDLKKGKIYRAEGNPSRKQFKEDVRLFI